MIEGGARICSVGYAVVGARLLGPEAWGIYWSAWGNCQILATATDLGGHLTVARRIAGGARRARLAIGESLRFKRMLVLVILPVAALLLPAMSPLAGTQVHVALLAAALCASGIEWLGCVLRGFGRIPEESLLLGVAVIAVLGSALAASFAGSGPPELAWAAFAVLATALIAGWRWTLRYTPISSDPPGKAPGRSFARAAVPTGIAILCSMASWRLGFTATAVWLWHAGGRHLPDGDILVQAGFYAVAHRLLDVARFLPAAATAALLPNLAARDPRVTPGRVLVLLVPAAALLAAVCQVPVTGRLAVSLFGAGFADAAPAFRAVSLALPFLTVNAVLTMWLVATDRVKLNAALSLIHCGVHAAGILAVARPGVSGLAEHLGYALVTAEAALCAGTLLAWRRLK